jgi:hypothetical protein
MRINLHVEEATNSIARRLNKSSEAQMLKSVEGIYRHGKVELLEPPGELDDSRVIVTFLPAPASIDLAARGIDESQAADLRRRLQAFSEDWNRPDMGAYDAL